MPGLGIGLGIGVGSGRAPILSGSQSADTGVVGCSMSTTMWRGWLLQDSDVWDAVSAGYGGGDISDWFADIPNGDYWNRLDTNIATNTVPDKVWFHICVTTGSPSNITELQAVMDQLKVVLPLATFYVSPVPRYETPSLCTKVNHEQSDFFTDWLVDQGEAVRGPEMTTVLDIWIADGGCHMNDTGRDDFATVLTAFDFDAATNFDITALSSPSWAWRHDNDTVLSGDDVIEMTDETSAANDWTQAAGTTAMHLNEGMTITGPAGDAVDDALELSIDFTGAFTAGATVEFSSGVGNFRALFANGTANGHTIRMRGSNVEMRSASGGSSTTVGTAASPFVAGTKYRIMVARDGSDNIQCWLGVGTGDFLDITVGSPTVTGTFECRFLTGGFFSGAQKFVDTIVGRSFAFTADHTASLIDLGRWLNAASIVAATPLVGLLDTLSDPLEDTTSDPLSEI